MSELWAQGMPGAPHVTDEQIGQWSDACWASGGGLSSMIQMSLLPVCGQHSHFYSVVASVLMASWLHTRVTVLKMRSLVEWFCGQISLGNGGLYKVKGVS